MPIPKKPSKKRVVKKAKSITGNKKKAVKKKPPTLAELDAMVTGTRPKGRLINPAIFSKRNRPGPRSKGIKSKGLLRKAVRKKK